MRRNSFELLCNHINTTFTPFQVAPLIMNFEQSQTTFVLLCTLQQDVSNNDNKNVKSFLLGPFILYLKYAMVSSMR